MDILCDAIYRNGDMYYYDKRYEKLRVPLVQTSFLSLCLSGARLILLFRVGIREDGVSRR